MFPKSLLLPRIRICRSLNSVGYICNNLNITGGINNYHSLTCHNLKSTFTLNQRLPTFSYLLHLKCYSHVDDKIHEENTQREKELNNIRQLFTQPRVILNELTAKTPEKIFEIHYKQANVAPKGSKKKPSQNDWTCAYSFVWPEKIKFEGTSISKRQAAEKAAIQALHWLYINKRIDKKGNPIYDTNVLQTLKSTINSPIQGSISERSIEKIEKIWNEYESEIKTIYDATFKEAKQRHYNFPVRVQKDSTIDEDDGIVGSEEEDKTLDFRTTIHPVFGKLIEAPSSATLARRERHLERIFKHYEDSLTPLPIDQYAEEITSKLETSRVAVIVGAAGCGKSTRVPAAILRNCGFGTTAIVSEPRRVAAIGLAQRVADELGENVGETVGYQVRLQSKPPRPPAGAILFCTSGVLLRRLQFNPGLEGCTHVIIDEAHERDVNTDITLLLLKRALKINPKLKIVVMSATLDIGVFTRYFEDCPLIEVPGRTFPVKDFYLDDVEKQFNIKLKNTRENCTKEDGKPLINCQEVVEVIKAVDNTKTEGAILVFLPGWAEIKKSKELLDQIYNDGTHLILPVHSRLSTADQTKMFNKPPPGVRKIVLSTNIAETSVTIPDVVHVIDTGAHKENRVKQGTGTASLETVWVSKAGSKQRAGRAGRVQSGFCYKLYSKEKEADFTPHTTPEILRIPLDQTVLDCKTYAPEEKVEDFLSQLPQPPSKDSLRFAVNDLIDLGALSKTEQLTRLGILVSHLNISPRLARGVLHSAIVGNVVAAGNLVAHCSDNVEVFANAADRKDEIRNIKRKFSLTSDHTALHWIQDSFEQKLEEVGWREVDGWCDMYGLRKDRLAYVKSLSNLHLENLLKCGMLEKNPEVEDLNRYSNIDEMTSAILLSGSNTILFTKKMVKTKGKLKTAVELFTSVGERAHIGGESINYGITKRKQNINLLTYFGGYHSIERRALVVHKTTLISPLTALLFSMGDVQKKVSVEDTTDLYLPRHRLTIEVPTSQADHILRLREMLWNTFEYYIERNVNGISFEEFTKTSAFKNILMKTVARVLVEANSEYVEKFIKNTDFR
ncbi:ATP-dependent RNA helicase DHX30 isoform X1 [Pieris rapae]|uniref:ATP-dependent RNA helicase DHX30 isoform X1 n=1 Tax=Pieris rapae TaxID=64459 RepID=UPI001E27E8FC|nr:ATP-dependent RNA helicase DHX30 isoform X1 [Pieris rapae]